MLLSKDKSCVLLVDVQEKLTPLVRESQNLINRCSWLLKLASDLGVPCTISEQYPSGLGASIAQLSGFGNAFAKIHFSCWRDSLLRQSLKDLKKQQIILIGIETHVCVLQTAIDMIIAGLDVFVVVDAVSSRHNNDHKYGLKRMKQAGANLVTSEMIFFEWLEQAGTAKFKELSQKYFRDQEEC